MSFKQVFGRFLIVTFVFISGVDKFINTQKEAEKLTDEIKSLYTYYQDHGYIFPISIPFIETHSNQIVLLEGVALITGCLLFFLNYKPGRYIISFMFLMCNLIDHNIHLYSGNELRIHIQLSLLNFFIVAATMMAGSKPLVKSIKID